jgi:hypothetical protein
VGSFPLPIVAETTILNGSTSATVPDQTLPCL